MKGVFSKLSLFAYTILHHQRIAALNRISQANWSSNRKPFARETGSHFLATSVFLFFCCFYWRCRSRCLRDISKDTWKTRLQQATAVESTDVPNTNSACCQPATACCQTNAQSVWCWTVDRFILRGSYKICLPINFLKITTNSLKT